MKVSAVICICYSSPISNETQILKKVPVVHWEDYILYNTDLNKSNNLGGKCWQVKVPSHSESLAMLSPWIVCSGLVIPPEKN